MRNRRLLLHKKFLFTFFYALIIGVFNTAYPKDYRITPNDGPFEKQLTNVVGEINGLPGTSPVNVRIEKGYYCLPKTIALTEGRHKITFMGSGNRETIIAGSIPVKGWVIDSNGLWRCQLPADVVVRTLPDQLYVNGERAVRSRMPNYGFYVLESSKKEDALHGAVLKPDDFKAIRLTNGDDIPMLTISRKWTVSKRFLVRFSRPNCTLYFSGQNFPVYNPLVAGNGIIIENMQCGIDIPGEWCVDKNGVIWYLPKKGETIDNTEFRIPVVEKLITINSGNGDGGGFCFKNLVFEHTSFQMSEDGCELGQAASRMSAAIEIDDIRNLSFENCEVRNTGNYGIWLRQNCSDSDIISCYFHDLGAGAIKIGTVSPVGDEQLTNHITVDNCIVYNYGVLMENAVGIVVFNASDCSITHNDIHFGNYTGISLGWVWGYGNSPTKRNDVAYNRISHIGTGLLNDLAGIYTLGESEGTHIHHNVISEVKSGDLLGWGIYADEGTSGVLIDKNIVYRSPSGGYHQHYGSNNVVTNNIFAWGEISQFTLTAVKEKTSLKFVRNIVLMDKGKLMTGGGIGSISFEVGNNCYWSISDEPIMVVQQNVETWIKERDTTSVVQDPAFKDPQNGNFRFHKRMICKTIGFEAFDYTKAGVYGKRKWKKLAEKGLR